MVCMDIEGGAVIVVCVPDMVSIKKNPNMWHRHHSLHIKHACMCMCMCVCVCGCIDSHAGQHVGLPIAGY